MEFNILVRINIFHSWFPVSPTYSHLGTVSSSHGLYSARVLAKHIQVWNQDSLGYGMESGWCCKPFSGAVTITGVVVRGFRSSSVAVTHEGIFGRVTRADLSGSGPHKLMQLSIICPTYPSTGQVGDLTICAIKIPFLGAYSHLNSP